MKKETVVNYFGNETETAIKLDITPQSVNGWKDGELIPERCALMAQIVTNGELKYNAALYRKRRKHFAAKRLGTADP